MVYTTTITTTSIVTVAQAQRTHRNAQIGRKNKNEIG